MKFTWTVVDDDPDWAMIEKHAITGLYAPMFDDLTTRDYLKDFKRRGYVAGIYLGAGWRSIEDAEALAAEVAVEYERVKVPGLRVMFNLEEHEPEKIARVLEEWRALYPTVGTSWSMEGKQGGWMGGNMAKGNAQSPFVTRILRLKVRLVPQLFLGNMTPLGEDDVMWDIACRGFPPSIISPFYDAKAYPPDADGFFFTAGRLT